MAFNWEYSLSRQRRRLHLYAGFQSGFKQQSAGQPNKAGSETTLPVPPSRVALERPVQFPRRAAGIVAGFQSDTEGVVEMPSADDEHFLRIDTQRQLLGHAFQTGNRLPSRAVVRQKRIQVGLRCFCHKSQDSSYKIAALNSKPVR